MPTFKSDESFLEKLVIGALGARKVFDFLERTGHQPIELERGSLSYKIWKNIKIKRIRVPDILCVRSGIRIESRAKTKLEISMSHSLKDPERGWDVGLKDSDFVAIVICQKIGNSPIEWEAQDLVQFLSVKGMREAAVQNRVVYTKPKGSQEGFEARVKWVSTIATSHGEVTEINNIIKYRTIKDRTNWTKLSKSGVNLKPQVRIGETVIPNQILASVVDVWRDIPLSTVGVDYYLNNLTSVNLSERYASAKALSYFSGKSVISALEERISDEDEHIFVRLEASASLARLGVATGYEFISECLKDKYLQNVLETVIVLAEIKTEKACSILCQVLLDENYDSEIRAGAAWGLGELNNYLALSVLINSFNQMNMNVRIEAARALAKLTEDFSSEITNYFLEASSEEKPGIAWALSRSNFLDNKNLIENLSDVEVRHWTAYILGSRGEERCVAEIEELKHKDPEVYFAVTLLWKIITSYVNNLKEY